MEMIMQIKELEHEVFQLQSSLDTIVKDYKEYKEAMEFYMGRGRCLEALEQYRHENK